jgi:4-amino-4-deoxy-L-arabinose transferase-like glycosyltransferase
LPVIALSLALAALVFVWGRQLYGRRAALLPLLLYCFDPNLIAHSSVATLDLGVTAAFSLTIYMFWRYLRTRRSRYLALTGIALGAAATVKLPGLLLLIALPALVFATRRDEEQLTSGHVARFWAVIPGLALLVMWAVYRFSLGPVSLEPEAVRLPLGQYWQTVSFQLHHEESGHVAYLLGRTSDTGWWYYFPVAFLVKTSLPLLILLGLAFSRGRLSRDELFLVIPAAIFFLAVVGQKLNLGIRYILPVYPLLIILTGRTLTRPWPANWGSWPKRAVLALGVWAVAEALVYSPHYLAYFNELAGGPRNGSRVLVDSNLDWGQDLQHLAAWQREHPEADPLYFAYFGAANVALYGVDCERLPDLGPKHPPRPSEWYLSGSRPRSGWIAISVNCLKLLPAYRWLESYEPVDRAGYSILIYHIPARSGNSREPL